MKNMSERKANIEKEKEENIGGGLISTKGEKQKYVAAELFYMVYGVTAVVGIIILSWILFVMNTNDSQKIAIAAIAFGIFIFLSWRCLKFINIRSMRILEIAEAKEDWIKLLLLSSYIEKKQKKENKYLL